MSDLYSYQAIASLVVDGHTPVVTFFSQIFGEIKEQLDKFMSSHHFVVLALRILDSEFWVCSSGLLCTLPPLGLVISHSLLSS